MRKIVRKSGRAGGSGGGGLGAIDFALKMMILYWFYTENDDFILILYWFYTENDDFILILYWQWRFYANKMMIVKRQKGGHAAKAARWPGQFLNGNEDSSIENQDSERWKMMWFWVDQDSMTRASAAEAVGLCHAVDGSNYYASRSVFNGRIRISCWGILISPWKMLIL